MMMTTIDVTRRILVERYHRAFDEELPRLERLGWNLARQVEVEPAGARALMNALLLLKDDLLRHTAVAETTVHPHAGTPDGDVLLADHTSAHPKLRAVIAEARDAARTLVAAGCVARALKDGLENLEHDLEAFFAREHSLSTGNPLPHPATAHQGTHSSAV